MFWPGDVRLRKMYPLPRVSEIALEATAHLRQGGDRLLLRPVRRSLATEEPVACRAAGSLMSTLLGDLQLNEC